MISGRRNYDDSVPWWGADGPTGPARVPVFVLTHDVPESVPDGGVYTFVTGGIERTLEQAQATAGDKDVTVMGGAETSRRYITGTGRRDLDPSRPAAIRRRTRMFENLGKDHIQLENISSVQTAAATHLRFRIAK